MTYEIVTKYIKDLNFKINDAKSYFLLEKDIKNYSFVCDIKSKKLKEKIVQSDINLRLVPVNKTSNRKLNSDDILLLDSGGQYKLGTTDVTRTLSTGKAKKIQSLNCDYVSLHHLKKKIKKKNFF